MGRRSRSFAAFVTALILVTMDVALAAPGDLDPAFSDDGWTSFNLSPAGETFFGVTLDGNAGYACASTDGLALVRFRANGEPDTRFDNDGVVQRSFGASTSADDCLVLQDGRVAVVGWAGNTRMLVAVYRKNGELSNKFSRDGVALLRAPGQERTYGYAIAQQADEKLVVAGESQNDGADEGKALVVRLHLNGKLDRTFNGDGWYLKSFDAGLDTFSKTVIDRRGRILAGGHTEVGASGPYDSLIVRLTPSGRHDKTFSGDGVVIRDFAGDGDYDMVLGLDVTGSGKPVASIQTHFSNGIVLRMTPRGRLDRTFASDGTFNDFLLVSPYRPEDLDLVPGFGIVLTGFITSGPTANVTVVVSDGSGLKGSFGAGGVSMPDDWGMGGRFNAGAIDAQGRLVAVGDTGDDLLIARLQT